MIARNNYIPLVTLDKRGRLLFTPAAIELFPTTPHRLTCRLISTENPYVKKVIIYVDPRKGRVTEFHRQRMRVRTNLNLVGNTWWDVHYDEIQQLMWFVLDTSETFE